MTDLTEQWKKGELPSGWYWVEGNRAESIYAYTAEYLNNMYRPRNGERIVEPVPSYEEYTKLKEELKDYEYQHKQDGICYNDIFCKLELARKENAQLRELLKKCVELMGDGTTYMHIDVYRQRKKDVLNAINQALGEDK